MSLLEEAIAAHGGIERWRQAEVVSIEIDGLHARGGGA
jgi:hypothetical protein